MERIARELFLGMERIARELLLGMERIARELFLGMERIARELFLGMERIARELRPGTPGTSSHGQSRTHECRQRDDQCCFFPHDYILLE